MTTILHKAPFTVSHFYSLELLWSDKLKSNVLKKKKKKKGLIPKRMLHCGLKRSHHRESRFGKYVHKLLQVLGWRCREAERVEA